MVVESALDGLAAAVDDDDDENNAFWTAWKLVLVDDVPVPLPPPTAPPTSMMPLDDTPSDGDGYRQDTRDWKSRWLFTTAVMAGIDCGLGKIHVVFCPSVCLPSSRSSSNLKSVTEERKREGC